MNKLLVKISVLLLILAVVLTSCEVNKQREEATGEIIDDSAVSTLTEKEKDSVSVVTSTAESVMKARDFDVTIEAKSSDGKTFSLLSQDTVNEYNKEVDDDAEKLSYNEYKSITYFVDFDGDSSNGKDLVSKYFSYVLADGTETKIVSVDAENESNETSSTIRNSDKLIKDLTVLIAMIQDNKKVLPDTAVSCEVSHREIIEKLFEIAGEAPVIKITCNLTGYDEKIEAEIKLNKVNGGISVSVRGDYVDEDEENKATLGTIDTSFTLKLSDDFDIINTYTKENGEWDDGKSDIKGDVTVSIDKLKLMLKDEDDKVDISVSGSATLDVKALTLKAALVISQSFNDKPLLNIDAEYDGSLNKDLFSTDALKIYKCEIGGTSYSAVSVKTIINAMLHIVNALNNCVII